MTKKTNTRISATLATATCALLGTVPAAPANAQEIENWDFDTSLLYYGEDNDRVQDASLGLIATRKFLDDESLTLGLTVDSLTGATPHGRVNKRNRHDQHASNLVTTWSRGGHNANFATARNHVTF